MKTKLNKLKESFKTGLQVIGVPVDDIVKNVDACVDVLKHPKLNKDQLDQMIKHIEAIESSIRKSSSKDFEDELDDLKQAFEVLTNKLRDQLRACSRKAVRVDSADVQDLLEDTNQKLDHHLSIFNSKVLMKFALISISGTQALKEEIQALKEDQKYLGDVIPYRKLTDLEGEVIEGQTNGVFICSAKAKYENQVVIVKTFRGQEPKQVWEREVKLYEHYRGSYFETMLGKSLPNEKHPYVVVSHPGLDIRQFVHNEGERSILGIVNMLESLEGAFGHLYNIGCYSWDSITIKPDGTPVIKPKYEDSRCLDNALGSIVEMFLSRVGGGPDDWESFLDCGESFGTVLLENLRSCMITEGAKMAEDARGLVLVSALRT